LFQLKRFIQQNLGLAATAFGVVIQAFGRDTVEAVAVGAGDEEWVGHERSSAKISEMWVKWRRAGKYQVTKNANWWQACVAKMRAFFGRYCQLEGIKLP
jgi:hypothetical protein